MTKQPRFAIGDEVYAKKGTTPLIPRVPGIVEKVGRKWIHVRFTQAHGASWVKRMLLEWLKREARCAGMEVNDGCQVR